MHSKISFTHDELQKILRKYISETYSLPTEYRWYPSGVSSSYYARDIGIPLSFSVVINGEEFDVAEVRVHYDSEARLPEAKKEQADES